MSKYKYVSLPKQTIIFGAIACFGVGMATSTTLIRWFGNNASSIPNLRPAPPLKDTAGLKNRIYNPLTP